MSEPVRTRASQKAHTRATIRAVAHEMFGDSGFEAVTIVDIAAAAGVSVQTVFNHFASKEELFFADRAPWVDGPAAAVRDRAPSVNPTTALRRHLVTAVDGYARAIADPQHRRMIEVLESTPALQTYERSLHEETVAKLGEQLAKAAGVRDDDPTDRSRKVLAQVTASVWMAVVRTVVVDLRRDPSAIDESAVRGAVALIERVLRDLDGGLSYSVAGVAAATSRAS